MTGREAPPALERAVLDRKGKREGDEIRFQCPFPDRHRNGDAKPSARYNPGKQVWTCDACPAGGGWTKLCEILGVDLPQATNASEAIYTYTDEKGDALFEVIRKANPKRFPQRRPNGKGGWIWGLKGVRRVLYRLPETLAAVEANHQVYVAEGEKDVDNLTRLGLAATTCPGGAGKWNSSYSPTLAGARVAVLPDNDEPGARHAEQIAAALMGVAAEVRIVELPGLSSGGDVSNWISAQAARSDKVGALKRLVEETPLWCQEAEGVASTPQEASDDSTAEEAQPPKQVQTEKLLALASTVSLFHTSDGEAYGSIPCSGHDETWAVNSRPFERWLEYQFFLATGRPPDANALKSALRIIGARACYEGGENKVAIRVAEQGQELYLDLGNDQWEVVRITPSGWGVVSEYPVKLTRSSATLPLVGPERHGDIQLLQRFVNVPDERDFHLVVAWLLATLRPRGPFPILVLQGEQGAAKSTTSRILRSLVDPVKAPIRTLPSSEQDLMIAAQNSWLLCFDNISSISAAMSDAICRLATGGGMSTRMLYTNQDEQIFDAQRPVMINGIEYLTTRHDLLDRALILRLPPIPSSQRRAELELLREFETARPRIIGALLTAAAMGLRRLPDVSLGSNPRMADFANWSVACEPALPWPVGSFAKAYAEKQSASIELAIEGDEVALAVQELLSRQARWSGTASELLRRLGGVVGVEASRRRGWPKSANSLSSRLARAATHLRAIGIEVDRFKESGSGSRRLISIERVADSCDAIDAIDAIDAPASSGPGTSGFGPASQASTATQSDAERSPDNRDCVDRVDGVDPLGQASGSVTNTGPPIGQDSTPTRRAAVGSGQDAEVGDEPREVLEL